jgi:hypothetical protein
VGVVNRRGAGIVVMLVAGTAAMLGLGSCRGIADLRDLDYVAPAPRSCRPTVLPTTRNDSAFIRLVNAGTRGTSDFCVRAAGTSNWGTSIFASGGPSCLFGLGYGAATKPFDPPAGKFDVKAIPAGASCDAAATSELDGALSAAGVVSTVLRFGGGHQRERIAVLHEDVPTNVQSAARLRVVDALSSGQSINEGYPSSLSLPATVPSSFLPHPIAPGHVEPPDPGIPGVGAIDAQGYLNASPEASFGVVFQGSEDALFTVVGPSFNIGTTRSAYAIGDSADAKHPVQGLICNEDDGPAGDAGGILADCSLSQPAGLVVDTLNTGLFGADSAFPDERRMALEQAIASRTSTDLMCLLEVDADSDKEAIAKLASAHFPYSYYVATNLDSSPTDATNAKGQTPPPPAGAPCDGVDPQVVAGVIQCTTQNCATPPDMTGHIATTQCLKQSCLFNYAQLYRQGAQENACFDCIIYHVSAEASLAHVQQECTTDSRQPFAFDGMNGSLILSHYPLANTKAYVLPGTGYRRTGLYAEVQLTGGLNLDFFCSQMVSPLIDTELPYVGNYGQDATHVLPDGGQSSENGWEEEQTLQIQRLVPWIVGQNKATGNAAIVAGDWHATVGVNDDVGTVILGDQSPEVVKALDSAYGGPFTRATPQGQPPRCDYCPAPTDVYNPGVIPEAFATTYLLNFPADSSTDDVVWATENIVPITSIRDEPAPAPEGPLSPYFGRSVHLIRPSKP